MNRLIIASAMLLFGGVIFAQDTLSRATTSSGGAWLSKSGLTLFGVAGQTAIASDLVSAENGFEGTVGFVGPITNIGQNNPPVALAPDATIFLEDSTLILDGFDPDGDQIFFEIETLPQFGSVTEITAGEYLFEPVVGLNPGELYTDVLLFSVNDGELSSEIDTLVFQFVMEDVAHQVTGIDFDGANFAVNWQDLVANATYSVEVEYYDLSDPETAGFRSLILGDFEEQDVTQGDGNYSVGTSVSAQDDPYLINGNQVFVTASVITPNGVGSFEAFVIDNTTGARTTASADGEFFAFGADQVVRENRSVELSLYSVELGDFDGSTAIVEILTEGARGTISTPEVVETTDVLKEWSVTYQATEEVGGLDSIQFRVFNQDRQAFDTAWARIEIIDVNDPPRILPITNKLTQEDTPLQFEIFASDPDNEISIEVQSNENTLAPATFEEGFITVSPQNNFSGRLSVSVVVTEIGTEENYVAYRKFDVEVLDVDDPPVMDDIPNAVIDEDNTLTFLANATDVDATIAVFNYRVEVSDPSAIDAQINGNVIQIIPQPNVNGIFNISVFADDGQGKPTSISLAETFELTINAVNDAPEIIKSFRTQQIISGLPDYTLDLSAYFTDVENGADLDYTFEGNSEIALSLSGSLLTIAPSEAFNSVEDVTVTASDGESEVSQTLTFAFVQTSPDLQVANPVGDFSLLEDFGTAQLDVSNVFEDINDPAAVFEYSLSGGAFISGTIDEQGQITFTAPENFNGIETFYLFGSVNGASVFESFQVAISPVNDAPVVASLADREMLEDQQLTGVFLSVVDVDNEASELTLTIESDNPSLIGGDQVVPTQVSNGFLFDIEPIADANGSALIDLSISDGLETVSTSLRVEVLAVNDQPTAISTTIDDAFEDVSYSVDLSTLFTDIDQDALSFELSDAPSWLSLTGSIVQGTPGNDFVGLNSIAVRVDDQNGGVLVQAYTFEVINVNDDPVLSRPIADLSLLEDFGSTEIDLLDRFEDVDGDALTFSIEVTDASIVTAVESNGILTLSEISNGVTEITVTADDGNGGTAQALFTVTVTNVNDAPALISALADESREEGFGSVSINLLNSFVDEDGDAITFEVESSNAEVVTVAIENTSSLVITEQGIGVAEISVTGLDGNGGVVTTSFSFEVTEVAPLSVQPSISYSIYPNPVSNDMYIKGDYTTVQWKITDTAGRTIDSDVVTSGQPIDVSKIKAGIYFLQLEGVSDVIKVVIRR